MFNDQTDISNFVDLSYEDAFIFIAVLATIALAAIVLQIRKVRRRRSLEIPIFIELMNDPSMRNFLASPNCSEFKLKSYRSVYGVACCLDGFYKELRNKITTNRAAGLEKILANQISLVSKIIYNPEITHLLYDTEETKLSAAGLARVKDFKEQLHKTLLRYSKKVKAHKREKTINNTNSTSGELVSTPVHA